MRYLLILTTAALSMASCKKKKNCLSQPPDDVHIVIEDSTGHNLLDDYPNFIPSAFCCGGVSESGSRFEMPRSLVTLGTEAKMALKIDLVSVRDESTYGMWIANDHYFEFMIDKSPKDVSCDYKKYTGYQADSFTFMDSTFSGSGVHIYVYNP